MIHGHDALPGSESTTSPKLKHEVGANPPVGVARAA